MKTSSFLNITLGTLVSLVLATGCKPKPGSDTTGAATAAAPTVRVSFFSWPGYAFWFVAKEKNLVPEINLDIKIIENPYDSFGLMAADQLDITSSTVEYGPIAADQNVPLKFVAYTNPSSGTDKIILGPGINGAADLKGKEVAVLEGGLTQIYMGIWLEQNGMKFDDVKYTNLVMDDAVAAMVSGKVAAGEFWEPFGGKVLSTLPGTKVASTSTEPYFKKTALLGDGMYMSASFLKDKPELAKLAMKAYFEAVKFWQENPAEATAIIAKNLKFPEEDVTSVIGKDGSSATGGVYPFNWQECLRFMGLAEGEPPYGANGEITRHWDLTTEWWLKFGVIKKASPIEAGVDLSPLKTLLDSGYGK